MQKSNNHCFTRDGITYDCYARNRRHGDHARRWYITAHGVERPAFEFAGNEITSRENISAFEDRVVSFVTDATPP